MVTNHVSDAWDDPPSRGPFFHCDWWLEVWDFPYRILKMRGEHRWKHRDPYPFSRFKAQSHLFGNVNVGFPPHMLRESFHRCNQWKWQTHLVACRQTQLGRPRQASKSTMHLSVKRKSPNLALLKIAKRMQPTMYLSMLQLSSSSK